MPGTGQNAPWESHSLIHPDSSRYYPHFTGEETEVQRRYLFDECLTKST